MVRVSVFYPTTPDAKFDMDYFAGKHAKLVADRLRPLGLARIEADKGLSGAEPGSSAPFAAAGHMYFDSLEDFGRAFAAHSAELMADIPNYTDIEPQIQISEIMS